MKSIWGVLLVVAVLAGCGGDGRRDPVFGADGIAIRAPRVTAISPVDQATGVSILSASVVATFSEPVATGAGAVFTVTCAAPCASPTGTVALNAAGTTATFAVAPGTNLVPLTLYSVTVNGYRSVDSGLALESAFTSQFTTAATPDLVRPTVMFTVPATTAPGPVGVATNTSIHATFSEDMAPATINATSMTVTCATPCTAPAGTVSYVAGSRNAIFTLASPLAISTTYTVTVTTGAMDLAGNALAGNQAALPAASNYIWRFTTGLGADSAAPTVIATSPLANATGVPINTLVTATFSEAMNPVTITAATFTLACPGGTAIAGTVGYASSGNVATFTPASSLPTGVTCNASISTGVKDAANNAMATAFNWSFTTGTTADVIAPTVTSTRPAANATGAAVNTLVAATFSEQMNPLTLTNATFTVACPAGSAVVGTVAVNSNVATFTPAAALPVSTTCVANISTGARDIANNALASAFSWSFTTGAALDTTPPLVSAINPVASASGVAPDVLVVASFSEPMDPLTISTATFTLQCPASSAITGTVQYTANGDAATFTPAVALPNDTICVATIGTGARDVASNAMAASFSWSFRTGVVVDTTTPTVTATSPIANASAVAPNTLITANFSEAMSPPTLSATTFTVACPVGTPVTGTVGYAVNSKQATFVPATALPVSTTCVATLGTGVTDDAGNPLASAFSWNFTTGVASDAIAPAVLSTNPATAAVGVCINKTINATFSEAMDPLTITTATFTLAVTAGASVSSVVAYDPVTNIASLNPLSNLVGAPATNYTVTIVGGANGVKDVAGNALASDNVTVFTTNASTCTSAPALGSVASFGAFGGNSTLTNDGLNTVINGDVAVGAPSSSITGFQDAGGSVYTITGSNDGRVNGRVYSLTAPPGSVAGEAVTQARVDASLAFNAISPGSLPGGIDASSLAQCPTCGGVGGGPDELAGRTLPPGVYLSPSGSYDIGGASRTTADLVLDAGGDSDAVWIFQTAAGTGTLNVGLTGPATPAVPIQVQLINGAQARNVFWFVPAGATIGTGSTMVGTLLADASVTMSTTGGSPPTAVVTTLNGRAIALTAGTTMTNAIINVPSR
ncbi:MAG: Ig-like domain-containing protein [Steroidobacteraceae bacterium]